VLQDQSSSSFSFGHDLIRHNLVVFRGGEGALQVLPSLVDVIPEARLNLVIYYLKQVRFVDLYGPFAGGYLISIPTEVNAVAKSYSHLCSL
jgi:hypothetical protein